MANIELSAILEWASWLDERLVDMMLAYDLIPRALVGSLCALLFGAVRYQMLWDTNIVNKGLQSFICLPLALDRDEFLIAFSIAEHLSC